MKSAHLVHVTITGSNCLEWQAKMIGQACREKSTDDDVSRVPTIASNDCQPHDLGVL
jgi:hypothetical protein